MEWQPIETAPRDGTVFLCMVSGLPYAAKFKDGRFIWYWHSNKNGGASYYVHEIDGKRLLEEKQCAPQPEFVPSGHLWVNGFDENPTHWMPLPNPPEVV